MIDAAMINCPESMTSKLPQQVPPTDGRSVESAIAVNAAPTVTDGSLEPSQRDYVAQLFAKHRAALHRYLARLVRFEDAAELVQETYYRLLRHGSTVRLEAMARAFLFHTATNLARDHRRRRLSHRADQHTDLETQEIAQEHLGPDEQLAGEQTLSVIERAIADLPADTRTVFLLHRFRDLSYPQIAETMNLSTRTVARKMAEALERLGAVVKAAI
jgi:RNA polymerase sigma factor (sigma-70 family)